MREPTAATCASDGEGCYREDCGWPDQPCAAEPGVQAGSSGQREDGPEGNEGRAPGSSAAYGVVDNLLATRLQETGRGTMLGCTLLDVLATLDAIGLMPADVIVSGGSMLVVGGWERR